jgi:nitroreductase
MHDVLALMRRHRTVRAFLDTALDDADVRAAVEAAQCAATSSWTQGYCLLQVTERAAREQLAELCGGQPQVAAAGGFFVVGADTRRHRLIAARAGAPYEHNLEVFLLAVIDACLFAQNLNLAFEAQGHSTCYIGGLRNRLPEASALLEVPFGVFPLFGLCVGEAADDPGTRPRLPVEAVWMKDRYASDAEVLASVELHDDEAARYYAQRGAPGRTWSGGTWRKFKAPLREHLATYYTSQGARLE